VGNDRCLLREARKRKEKADGEKKMGGHLKPDYVPGENAHSRIRGVAQERSKLRCWENLRDETCGCWPPRDDGYNPGGIFQKWHL